MTIETIADVFIIESLEFVIEDSGNFPGKFLSQMLKFEGKKSISYYIRTKSELKEVMKLFAESNYRYLHICCHGNPDGLYTAIDPLPYRELGNILNPFLARRRLFVSACSAVNDDFASEIIPSSGCYSVVGPVKDIYFRRAAIVWASFYHLMFELDKKKMKRHEMLKTLTDLVQTFGVPLDYFSISSKSSIGYKRTKIR